MDSYTDTYCWMYILYCRGFGISFPNCRFFLLLLMALNVSYSEAVKTALVCAAVYCIQHMVLPVTHLPFQCSVPSFLKVQSDSEQGWVSRATAYWYVFQTKSASWYVKCLGLVLLSVVRGADAYMPSLWSHYCVR